MKYKIYAGVTNLRNGAEYQGTFKYANIHEAEQDAKEIAIEEYKKYEGTAHKSLDDIAEENDIDMSTDEGEIEAYALYMEEVESRIEYYVEEVQ